MNSTLPKLNLYGHKCLQNLESFLQQFHFRPKRLGIAVSTGIDSMALLWMSQYYNQKHPEMYLHVIHLNHGTRGFENQKEEDFLKAHCNSFDLPISILKLKMKKFSEDHARSKRYDFFKKIKNEFDLDSIWTGHHLDDSFEWSTMKRGTTSSLKSTLGIPLKNGIFVRPFLCLSKNQIKRFMLENHFSFFEDSTNSSLKFERNLVRHSLIPTIKSQYPHYLRAYVQQQNELAHILKCHLIKLDFLKKIFLPNIGIGFLIHHNHLSDFRGSESLIRDLYFSLTTNHRGEIFKEIKKCIHAAQDFMHGPINLSGGVRVFLFRGFLLLSRENSYEEMPQDTWKSYEQIPIDFDSITSSILFVLVLKTSNSFKKPFHLLPASLTHYENEIYGIMEYGKFLQLKGQQHHIKKYITI